MSEIIIKHLKVYPETAGLFAINYSFFSQVTQTIAS